MKRLLTAIAALIFVCVLALPAHAALRHFTLSVYKATSEQALMDPSRATLLTDNVAYTVFVYSSTSKSNTRETLYSDTSRTSLAQDPWVAESTFDDTGTIAFYCDPTETGDAKVRLLVVDVARGFSWSGDVQYNKDHAIIIDQRAGILHQLTFPISDSSSLGPTGGGIAKSADMGVTLSPGIAIVNAYVNLFAAASSASSIDGLVGTQWVLTSTDVYRCGAGPATDDMWAAGFIIYITDSAATNKFYMAVSGDSVDGLINLMFVPR
uniref:Uncharacterized protein n=1 Tax=viral metagenome TaxID=1070528 RepID=A0A6M3IHJ1_9ZZZZ